MTQFPPFRPHTEKLTRWGGSLRKDFLASLIVFLIALPLCLGIARACGLPPAAGLITGIIGGIVVGLFAGSPLQVSGPAAGLIVLVAALVKDRGVEALAAVLLIAGAIQLLAGILRLGQWFRAASPAVIEGMLAGIGVLIFASQFHIMIDDQPRDNGLANIASLPVAIWKGLIPTADANHHLAAWIGAVTILTIIVWKVFIPKRMQIVPAPLVAVVIGSALAAWRALPIMRVDLPNNLLDAVRLPDASTLNLLLDGSIWRDGVTMALVASAETLLCAAAVDQMHRGPRTRFDRELSAQGIGNLLCGLVGALPMTGVIVRSSANVEAGAKSRLSAILHGSWLLLLVLLLPHLLEIIPTSCLAGILVYTGYSLVDFREARRLYRDSRGEFVIYLATLMTIVLTDLLTGVIAGLVLSAIKLLYAFSHLEIRLKQHADKPCTAMHLIGSATFLRLPQLAKALEQVPANTELHIDLTRLTFVDHACLDLLMNWEKQHEAMGGKLVIDWERLHARFRAARPRRGDSTHSLEPVAKAGT